MPWVQSGKSQSLGWRLKTTLRRMDRRYGGTAFRRCALAASGLLVLAALILVV
jgi:hypothetical protein